MKSPVKLQFNIIIISIKGLHEDNNYHILSYFSFFLEVISYIFWMLLYIYNKEIKPDKVKDRHLFVEQAAGMILALSNYRKISEPQIINQSIFKILRTM